MPEHVHLLLSDRKWIRRYKEYLSSSCIDNSGSAICNRMTECPGVQCSSSLLFYREGVQDVLRPGTPFAN
jgi:hypothetical protein